MKVNNSRTYSRKQVKRNKHCCIVVSAFWTTTDFMGNGEQQQCFICAIKTETLERCRQLVHESWRVTEPKLDFHWKAQRISIHPSNEQRRATAVHPGAGACGRPPERPAVTRGQSHALQQPCSSRHGPTVWRPLSARFVPQVGVNRKPRHELKQTGEGRRTQSGDGWNEQKNRGGGTGGNNGSGKLAALGSAVFPSTVN